MFTKARCIEFMKLSEKFRADILIRMEVPKQNWGHIQQFAECEFDYYLLDGEKMSYLAFDCKSGGYECPKKKKIDWEKAMKNGAYGIKGGFYDDEDGKKFDGILYGYNKQKTYSFLASQNFFENFEPDDSVEIQDSWYED